MNKYLLDRLREKFDEVIEDGCIFIYNSGLCYQIDDLPPDDDIYFKNSILRVYKQSETVGRENVIYLKPFSLTDTDVEGDFQKIIKAISEVNQVISQKPHLVCADYLDVIHDLGNKLSEYMICCYDLGEYHEYPVSPESVCKYFIGFISRQNMSNGWYLSVYFSLESIDDISFRAIISVNKNQEYLDPLTTRSTDIASNIPGVLCKCLENIKDTLLTDESDINYLKSLIDTIK